MRKRPCWKIVTFHQSRLLSNNLCHVSCIDLSRSSLKLAIRGDHSWELNSCNQILDQLPRREATILCYWSSQTSVASLRKWEKIGGVDCFNPLFFHGSKLHSINKKCFTRLLHGILYHQREWQGKTIIARELPGYRPPLEGWHHHCNQPADALRYLPPPQK